MFHVEHQPCGLRLRDGSPTRPRRAKVGEVEVPTNTAEGGNPCPPILDLASGSQNQRRAPPHTLCDTDLRKAAEIQDFPLFTTLVRG